MAIQMVMRNGIMMPISSKNPKLNGADQADQREKHATIVAGVRAVQALRKNKTLDQVLANVPEDKRAGVLSFLEKSKALPQSAREAVRASLQAAPAKTTT